MSGRRARLWLHVRRHWARCIAVLLLVLGAGADVAGGEARKPGAIVVIARGMALQGADIADLANIYRRTLRYDSNGTRIVPVNLPVADATRRMFSELVFGQTPEDMQRYWNEMYYRGVSPPDVLASANAVRKFVAATPGAIGYVPDCASGADLGVIIVLPLDPDQQARMEDCVPP